MTVDLGRTEPSATPPALPAIPSGPLRVVMQCDQFLTSEAIKTALGAHRFTITGVARAQRTTQPRDVARAVAELRPHVGLLVQELVDPLRIGDSLRILREVPQVPWLVLSGSPEGAGWGAALEAGARAVLPMAIGLEALAQSLVRVARGDEVMAAARREAVLREWAESAGAQRMLLERIERLSPRELAVLRALSAGQAVPHIAEVDGVTLATVRSQVKSVLRKLEVRTQLAAVAMLQEALFPHRVSEAYRPPA